MKKPVFLTIIFLISVFISTLSGNPINSFQEKQKQILLAQGERTFKGGELEGKEQEHLGRFYVTVTIPAKGIINVEVERKNLNEGMNCLYGGGVSISAVDDYNPGEYYKRQAGEVFEPGTYWVNFSFSYNLNLGYCDQEWKYKIYFILEISPKGEETLASEKPEDKESESEATEHVKFDFSTFFKSLANAGVIVQMETDTLDRDVIESYQEVLVNLIWNEETKQQIQSITEFMQGLKNFTSKDSTVIQNVDTANNQDFNKNKEMIKKVFSDRLEFTGDVVSIKGSEQYDGEKSIEKRIEKIMKSGKITEKDKRLLQQLDAARKAAEYFAANLGNSSLNQIYPELPEDIENLIDASKDIKSIRTSLKGPAGTLATALYTTAKVGEKFASKIPLIGPIIESGTNVVSKAVMVLPSLDNAIKESRGGEIDNGPIGTAAPNAFLNYYGKRDEEGVKRIFTYTDDKGIKHEIRPEYWKKVPFKGKTYYVPFESRQTDKPAADVAIKEVDGGWKWWKWDNVQIIKRTDPNILYNNGEEYDL